MKSMGGRLGRREKAKQRNLWDWIGSKIKRHIQLITITVRGFVVLGGGQEITLTSQRYVILDAKRHEAGSVKVKIDLGQRSYQPKTRQPATARF